MEIHVNAQLLSFGYSILMGAVLCGAYDIIRLLRTLFATPLWLINIEDVIFAVIASFLGFGMVLVAGPSGMRFFIFGGILSGVILFENLIGKYAVKYGSKFLTGVNIRLKEIFKNIKKKILLIAKKINKTA